MVILHKLSFESLAASKIDKKINVSEVQVRAHLNSIVKARATPSTES